MTAWPLRLLDSAGFVTVGLASIAAALVLLNLDLYRFFARKRGLWFAVRALPLHWLYYAYCGLAVGLGLAKHLWHTLALATPWTRPVGVDFDATADTGRGGRSRRAGASQGEP
jgi:hypothetical protein